MENKIQELTDKIYREGVEKGNEEAQRLIANAQEEAKKIIEDARKEAESIVNSSRKSADELADNTKSEKNYFPVRLSTHLNLRLPRWLLTS